MLEQWNIEVVVEMGPALHVYKVTVYRIWHGIDSLTERQKTQCRKIECRMTDHQKYLMWKTPWSREYLTVPDHNGGRPIEVNACILIIHMVYL
jgi:hypothetical protein